VEEAVAEVTAQVVALGQAEAVLADTTLAEYLAHHIVHQAFITIIQLVDHTYTLPFTLVVQQAE
jgi:hypothetical protein